MIEFFSLLFDTLPAAMRFPSLTASNEHLRSKDVQRKETERELGAAEAMRLQRTANLLAKLSKTL